MDYNNGQTNEEPSTLAEAGEVIQQSALAAGADALTIDDYLIEQYRVQARQAKEYGLVRRDVSVDGWFDPQFLDMALKQLDLQTYWTRYGTDGKPQSGS